MKFDTKALHFGYEAGEDSSQGVPVHRTSAYLFKNTKHAADLFDLKEIGNIYTRLGNPTQTVLEQRVAALENGKGALALSSGTSAIFYTVINICAKGDQIVAANNLYGGTYTMFSSILPQFGIKTVFVDPLDPDNFRKATTDKTKLYYAETIGNPVLDVADIEAIAKIAKENKIPFAVDSTFTTPSLFRPLDAGADIVIHSMTKWLGGHGTGLGGIVIDNNTFDWKNERFPLFSKPESSYHNIVFADLPETLPPFITRMRLIPLRNLGACISPDNAWIFLQGIETLSLRMERHSANAMQAANFLARHPQVAWIRYPGLVDDPSHKTAIKQFKKGFGGMVVFGIKSGRKGGEKFIDNLKLFSHVANVGDVKSLAIHPASTTHSQLTEKEQKSAGITPDLIRLSIGIEDIYDILEDLDQALKG
jgi:O-acetylhomoserine (thiol)-lyase